MLLLIDIGNTSTSYGLSKGRKITGLDYCPSYLFPERLNELLKDNNTIPISYSIITSVVPILTRKIRKLCLKYTGPKRVWQVGKEVKIKIKHKYKHINKLGTDRLVNAWGAIKLYGPPLLLLDFGTALTCDYISKDGTFMGGLIIPGPEIALNALTEKAALLPPIQFPKKCHFLYGRDTKAGMQAGVLQGYGAMVDGLVERFRARFGSRLRVIATGGLARIIRPYTRRINVVDPLLTLKSLSLLKPS